MFTETKTLEELPEKYPIILMDTCALFYPLNTIQRNSDFVGKRLASKMKTYSSTFFRGFLENGGNLYVTPLCVKEFSEGIDYDADKVISSRGKRIKKDELRYYKQRKKEAKGKRDLLELLREKNGVLHIDEDEIELYGELMERCSSHETQGTLSDSNIDFLISGIVVSKMREPVCLVSNNFQLLFTWKKFMEHGMLEEERFGFYLRREFNGFEKAY